MGGHEGLDGTHVHGKCGQSGHTAARLRKQVRKGDALPIDMGKAMDERGESKPEAAPALGDAEGNHDGARARHPIFSTSSLRVG
jgi:hypothetical protein